jgi:hypothetical protein
MSAPDEGESSIIVSLTDAAMHMYKAAIDSLPFPEDKKFHKRADVVLAGLRKLQGTMTDAAGRNRTSASVIVSLSEVRRCYDDLMARAAIAPGASLGQQLYVARIRAKLSAQEAANGAGLRADLLDALEAGEIPTEAESAKIRDLIAALGGAGEPHEVPADEHAVTGHEEPHDFNGHEESNVNGWDQSFANG